MDENQLVEIFSQLPEEKLMELIRELCEVASEETKQQIQELLKTYN